jgi:hypothetical protein
VKTWDDYAGPFISLSAAIGDGWDGVGISWFFAPSNPKQFGTALAYTFGVAGGSLGLAWVTYKGADRGVVSPNIFLLTWPPIWYSTLSYKYANPTWDNGTHN